jgi:hypothetical protein
MFAVAGVQKPFSAVTEDDHELMTPDEYSVRHFLSPLLFRICAPSWDASRSASEADQVG